MTYIPRREITALIPNKFEAIRVLALECRRLNDELRAREETEVEGKLTTLAVKQMLEGKVTYYDAKERREQERSEAMLSAAEGLLDIDEPMIETDYELELQESGDGPSPDGDGAVATEETVEEADSVEAATIEEAPEEVSDAVEEAEETAEPAAAEADEDAAETVKSAVGESEEASEDSEKA